MPGGSGGLGTSTQTANTSQNGAGQGLTGPWAPAAAPIQNLLLPGIINQGLNYKPTAAENTAFSNAAAAAGGLPSLGGNVSSAAQGLLGGDPTGWLHNATGNLNTAQGALANNYQNLNPYATANPNPLQTPGIENLLSTIQNDVQNSVNSQFAGAGRSLSGLNQQALARGLSQGEAAPLLGQYNQNVSNIMNANQLQGGLSQTSGQLAGVQGGLAGLFTGNQSAGANLAAAAPGIAAAPSLTQQNILQQQRLAPVEGLGAFENLYTPLAALGGATNTMQNNLGTFAGSSTASPLQQLGQLSGGLFGNQGLIPGATPLAQAASGLFF